MKILTIAVPSYNVEMYLDKCISSLLNIENVNFLEILIVNDGSKDNTDKIANKFCETYPNIVKLINKQNGGHGSAINVGIENATGKYFRVLDGDDWIDTTNINQLLELMKICESDIICNNYTKIYVESGVEEKIEVCENFKTNYEYKFDEVCTDFFAPMASLNIKTSILQKNEIKMTEKCFYVDMEFTLFFVPYIESIEFFNKNIYQYRLGNITQSVNIKNMYKNSAHHEKVIRNLVNYFNESVIAGLTNEKKDYIKRAVGSMLDLHYNMHYLFPKKDKEKIKELKTLDKELKANMFFYHSTTRKNISLLRNTKFIMFKPLRFAYRLFKREYALK